MLPYLRFLFSDADAERIDASSIVVEDLPATGDFPMAMRVRFRVSRGGAPQIRPLLPGHMRFIVNPNAPGSLPTPITVNFTDAYNTWKVVGTLLINDVSTGVGAVLASLAPGLPVKPNRVWYSPVRLSKEFLFNTVCRRSGAGLPKVAIPLANGGKVSDSNWQRFALAQFLAGRYTPELQPSSDAATYQGIVLDMPLVELVNANEYAITVCTALAQNAKDAPDGDWDPGIADKAERDTRRLQASHPRNGAIPARLVYQALSGEMAPVADPAATPARDTIVRSTTGGYTLDFLRFTRAWQPTEDCSIHFTRQTVRFESDAGEYLGDQPLPAHGILFRDLTLTSPSSGLRVSVNGGMKWLLWSDQVWRQMGATTPVEIDQWANSGQLAHIVLRLSMSDAMLADPNRPDPGGFTCTYLSLRRAARALVDNRIAGGRLNFGVDITSKPTRELIGEAFEIANEEWENTNKRVRVSAVANNAPDPSGDPETEAPKLIPLLEAFFPTNAPQQSIPNPPANAEIFTVGRMAYSLWQTLREDFTENTTQRNFDINHLGRGGPGAAVALGLATYVLNPIQQANETEDAYITRVHTALIGNVQPGAALQLWNDAAKYESLRQRIFIAISGHSPVFVKFQGPASQPDEFIIIDQRGESPDAIQWQPAVRIGFPDIWIAANWVE